MRRLNLSDGAILSLTDVAPGPAAWSYSFPDADPEAHPEIVRRWLPDGQFHTRFTVFAWVRAGRILLVDAGLGAAPNRYFNGLAGSLGDEMRAAGLDPAAVELVMFTHFHLDHVGWATGLDGQPYFANARYVAPAAELAHWQAQGAAAALPHHVEAYDRHIAPLLAAGRLETAEAGQPMADAGWPEVAFRAVIGHTAGHHAVVIETGVETVVVAGDTWHSPAQIAVPDWCHRADQDHDAARAARRALAAWASDTGAIVAAGHFLEDRTFGRIASDGVGGFAFHPIAPADG